jgi:gas vesicle protein
MKSFLAGLGIGIGVGLLFAPLSGEETRENLAERASDAAEQASKLAIEGRKRARNAASALRGNSEATGTEGLGNS